MLAFSNGRFLPFAEGGLAWNDAGFVGGVTVVDNARTYRHRLFRWNDHLTRFRRDCARCFVPLLATDAELTAIAHTLISHNATTDGELQIVTFATPGPLGFYVGSAENGPPTLGMLTYPVPTARYQKFATEGVKLVTVGTHATASDILPPTVKHRSRMMWHIADQLAKSTPNAIALLSDDALGTLTETAIGSLLAVVDGTVVTPPRSAILDGISLQVIEELCHTQNIPFAESRLPLSAVTPNTELMLTGTGFGLASVRYLNDIELHWPGSMSMKLQNAWSDLIRIS